MNGVLVVNKPAGMTSHDVVFKLRKILNTKKIGHTGTLDPQATGVLLVLVGKACKVLQFLQDTDKTYRARIQLGVSTDTMDIWGNPVAEAPIYDNFDFDQLLSTFEGSITQEIPMTSAKKVNGKKLMDYQRQGIEIEKQYQQVKIYDIHSIGPLSFEAHCSSGTYIRSICYELAKKSGNEGCMASLERIQVGRFSIDQAQSLEQIVQEPIFYPVMSVLDHFEKIDIDDPTPIYHGKALNLPSTADSVLLVYQNQPLAIYEKQKDSLYRSKRGLW